MKTIFTERNRVTVQTEHSTLATEQPTRSYETDWLKVSGMLMVFCFHCARFFDFDGWHVKNTQLSSGMTLFVQILVIWMMPLFFVLSGIASFYALRCGSGVYLGGRVKRLLLPFLFGTFVLIPPQVWIERVSHGDFDGSLLAFWPHYFDGWYAFGGNFAWMGLHLWYLEMLFLWSLLTLPIFLLIRKLTISRFAEFFKKPAAIFLLAVPLVVIESLVNLQRDGVGIREFGGWSPFTYLVFFIILHQTVIVIIAFSMIDWQVGITVKYLRLWITSFVVILGLYEGIIKRFSVTRFLFGLKPLKKNNS